MAASEGASGPRNMVWEPGSGGAGWGAGRQGFWRRRRPLPNSCLEPRQPGLAIMKSVHPSQELATRDKWLNTDSEAHPWGPPVSPARGNNSRGPRAPHPRERRRPVSGRQLCNLEYHCLFSQSTRGRERCAGCWVHSGDTASSTPALWKLSRARLGETLDQPPKHAACGRRERRGAAGASTGTTAGARGPGDAPAPHRPLAPIHETIRSHGGAGRARNTRGRGGR